MDSKQKIMDVAVGSLLGLIISSILEETGIEDRIQHAVKDGIEGAKEDMEMTERF